VSDVYEFVDHSNKVDENVLAVDFHFSSDVTKEQAIEMVDKILLSNRDNSTAEMTGYTPTIFAISKWKETDDK